MFYIFTEGGKGIGYGHITRCLSIVQFYPKAKLIIYAKDKENVEKFLKKQSIKEKNYIFKNWHFGDIPDIKNKVIFIDSYLAKETLLKKLEKLSQKIIFYDDFKQRNYSVFRKDKYILINPSFIAKRLFPYKKGNFLLGPKYLLLRKAFFKVERKKINKNIKNIFLSLGGASHKEKEILINKINFILKSYNYNILIPNNLDDIGIKKLMEISDIAICAGGQTILELTRMGVPTISIALADNQMPTLNFLKEKNLTYFLGWYYEEKILDNLKKALEELKDYKLRKKLSEKLQSLIDGKGTLRIINTALGKRITP